VDTSDENEKILESESPVKLRRGNMSRFGVEPTRTLLETENRPEKSPEEYHIAKRLTVEYAS